MPATSQNPDHVSSRDTSYNDDTTMQGVTECYLGGS